VGWKKKRRHTKEKNAEKEKWEIGIGPLKFNKQRRKRN
jgi:hypothetical protein